MIIKSSFAAREAVIVKVKLSELLSLNVVEVGGSIVIATGLLAIGVVGLCGNVSREL